MKREDITFIESPKEIVISCDSQKGAKWISKHLTTNIALLHYSDKVLARERLRAMRDAGLYVRRREKNGTWTVVSGEYNEFGYEIIQGGRSIYSAGNAHGDSSMVVPLKRGVGIKDIRKFCIQTGKEFAEELFAAWNGASRIPNQYEGEIV